MSHRRIVLAALLVAASLTACSSGTDESVSPSPTDTNASAIPTEKPEPVETTPVEVDPVEVSYQDLEVGDCFSWANDQGDALVVPCTQVHDNEVIFFDVVLYEQDMWAVAWDAFEQYVGRPSTEEDFLGSAETGMSMQGGEWVGSIYLVWIESSAVIGSAAS